MKRSYILTLSLIVALAAAAILISIGSRFVAAQQSVEVRKPARWQYCSITGVTAYAQNGRTIATASICYFRNNGCHRQSVEATIDGELMSAKARADALAKATDRLGTDGWELIGDATQFESDSQGADAKAIYFRRAQRF